MRRVSGIAIGFALGVAAVGIGVNPLLVRLSDRLSRDAGGSMSAEIFFAVVAFGSLAIFGGLAIAAVAGIFRRWLPNVTIRGASAIGAGFGVAIAVAASVGALRPLQTLSTGSGALPIPGAVAGMVAGLLLIAASAVSRALDR